MNEHFEDLAQLLAAIDAIRDGLRLASTLDEVLELHRLAREAEQLAYQKHIDAKTALGECLLAMGL